MAPPPKRPAAASPPGGRRQRTGKAGSAASAGAAGPAAAASRPTATPAPAGDTAAGRRGAWPSKAVTQQLMVAATAARAVAYAPYSKFHVGAALLDEQGRIHAGCNVENAAYPQGVCAEGGALSAMVLAGGRRLQAVLVLGAGDAPCTPCGGCRQKLREFGSDTLPVLVADPTGLRARYTLGELLPDSFGPDHLKDPRS
jgi:cytidine deaminase